MISLYKTSQALNDKTHKFELYGSKSTKLKHRNLSNSKLAPLNYDSNNLQMTNKQLSQNQSSEIKPSVMTKYSLGKLKNVNSSTRFKILKKNNSMKIIKTENTLKKIDKTYNLNIRKPQSEECISNIMQDTNSIKELVKNKTLSIKRRVELVKKSQNALKINDKRKNLKIIQTKIPRSEDNLPEPRGQITEVKELKENIEENNQQKSHRKLIKSQNTLGGGLKKSSSSKLKVLVRNPFEKFEKKMKLQEQFKQSQIISKLDESFTSIAQRCELQEMLAMF